MVTNFSAFPFVFIFNLCECLYFVSVLFTYTQHTRTHTLIVWLYWNSEKKKITKYGALAYWVLRAEGERTTLDARSVWPSSSLLLPLPLPLLLPPFLPPQIQAKKTVSRQALLVSSFSLLPLCHTLFAQSCLSTTIHFFCQIYHKNRQKSLDQQVFVSVMSPVT
jgi:hypothetical protein